MANELSFIEKMISVQSELKAPKGKNNTFGGYKYRSCEDILEAVKPILKKYGLLLLIWDSIVQIGDRYYVKATVRVECESESREVSALAREPESKKGMDESQISGTASSYARKYALNGMFAIDDTKDADTDEYQKETANRSKAEQKKPAPEKKVTCAFCGKPITGGKVNGKVVTAEQIMDKSMKIYGELFCYPCMLKKADEKAARPQGGIPNA